MCKHFHSSIMKCDTFCGQGLKLLIILLQVCSIFREILGEDQVQYYENLIDTYAEAQKSYQPLTSSEYFVTADTKDDEPKQFGEYDFVIIGAGSTGSVIASRLSECKSEKVLLLEAGGNENHYSDIPAMSFNLQLTDFNWGYKTTAQSTCCLETEVYLPLGCHTGMQNEQCSVPRGKVLGGSSTINWYLYARGNRKDYDHWADLGNKGWSYKDVLPYFKKSEDCHLDHFDHGYHGHGGLLNVQNYRPNSPLTDAFFEANQVLGREIPDYNGARELGLSRTQFNLLHGRRQSGYKAFVKPVEGRKNLKVLTRSLALKLLVNRGEKQVVGVKFNHNGTVYVVKAKKEVVLSAGVINTPQLLMLSGIGPKDELEKLNISVNKDAPGVGQNLQDHAALFALIFTTNYTEPATSITDQIKQYLNGTGPLIGSDTQIAFVQTSTVQKSDLPDMECLISGSQSGTILQKIWNLKNETRNRYFDRVNLPSSFFAPIIMLNPKSKGNVYLTSKSPYKYPSININFLSDPEDSDIKTIYKGIKMSIEIMKQKPFAKYDTKLLDVPVPGCENKTFLSEEYWYCAIRHLCCTLYHGGGTARMGPKTDKNAVVDNMGLVYGIDGLRIADLSIAPSPVAGHTNAVAYMIGEKLSDAIKEKYKLINV